MHTFILYTGAWLKKYLEMLSRPTVIIAGPTIACNVNKEQRLSTFFFALNTERFLTSVSDIFEHRFPSINGNKHEQRIMHIMFPVFYLPPE